MPNPTLKLKLPAAAATLPLPALAASLLAASLLVLALLAAPAARAATLYWGGGTGALTDDNWFSDAALTTKVTRANGDTINLASGTLSITSSGTVYTTNIGLAAGDSASVIMDAPGGYWNNTASNFAIGSGLDSYGSLTVLSGSVRANTFYVGDNGTGYLYLAENTALITTANNFFGRNNTATANGSGTAIVHGYWSVIGSATNNGYFVLGNGTGSRDNYLEIGDHGKVEVTSRTGLAASTVYLRIGNYANSTGTMTIKSGGAFILSNTYTTASVTSIGHAAGSEGYLNIEQGGTFAITSNGASHFYIGNAVAGGNTGAYGEVNVDGYFSWNNIGTGDRFFAIGVGASTGDAVSPNATGVMNIGVTGTVIITGASEIDIGRMGVGSHSAGNMTHYLNSSSGTLNVAGYMEGGYTIIGRSGDGWFNLADTGTAILGNISMSRGHTEVGMSYGEANIHGYLRSTGSIDIGYTGAAVFNLFAGGTAISATDFTVGRATGNASGTRNSGTLNIWGHAIAGDNLVIANDGVGTLNLYAGGVAYSTNAANIAITAQSSGTFNLLGGFLSAPTFTWGAGAGVVTLSSGTLEIRDSAGALDIANDNALSGSGIVEKTGPGALGFGGDSSAFAGTLNIRSGALRSTAATARLGGDINIASGAALDLRSAALETTGNLTLADGALWMFSPTGQYQLTAGNLIIDGAGQIYLDPEVPLASIPVSYTLASYTTITGDTNIANWLVTASGTTVYGSTIAATAGSIQLQLSTIDASFLYWKGGDGDWSSAATDWRDGPSSVAWKHGSVGVFQNAPGTVNITGNQIFSTLQFDTDGYTLAGTGFLTGPLGGPLNFNVTTPAATATINVPVSGAALYKTGPGALVLGGPVTTTGATGHVLIDGGALAVGGETDIGGQLFVGGTATGTGAFVVKNGATVNQARETFVAYDGDSSGLVRIETGGVFNQNNGYFRIAGINNNAVATTGTLIIETGGTLNATENVHIGSSGAATVQIDGYLHTNASSYIGVYAGGNATVTVGQNGVFDSTGILSLGYNATSTGTLFVEGLARAGSYLRLGDGTGSQNNVLDIASTGTVIIGSYAGIGYGANAHGIARVAGLLDVGANLPIAYSGTSAGTLEILSGGTVIQRGQNSYVATAVGVDSTGTLIIRSGGYLDTGARTHASQANFGIGWAGQGSLLIETGGTAISAATDANSVAFSIGYGASAYGSADIAGTLVAATGYADIGQSGTGVLTIEDGGIFLADRVRLATGANARATVNLNGGVLEARQFILGAGGANVTVAFAGGTIRAAADESNFFQNFPVLPLASGTLNLDTQTFAVTATNALAGATDARLVKFGTGSLTLSADNSAYIGAVDVRAGSLDTAGARLGGSVTIGSGAAIRPTVAGGVIDNLTIAAAGSLDLRNAPLTAGNLTLADGALWQYSLSGTHVIDVTGILDIAGSGTFYLSRDGKDIALIPGSYTLATYTGITGDTNLATWQITASDFSLTANTALDTLSVPNTLKININTADVDLLHWQGGDGDWDTSTASFRRTGSPTAWNDGALAVFSTGSGAVDITGVRTIYALQFDTDGYTLGGSGALAAASAVNIHLTTPGATTTINTTLDFPGLNKLGPGDLVLGGASAFTEAVNVAGGSLTVAPTGDIASATLDIALDTADTAAVTLDSGALWQSAGRVTVGGSGAATLDIADGAALTVNGAYVFIGDAAGSSGTATVAGLMQTVSSGEIHVGRYGDGALVIAQTGTVKSAVSSHIARYSGTGRATVAGLWENTADLALGFAADAVGVIDIRSTGAVTGRHAYIGYGAGGTGTATVAGLWQNSGNLYVGRQGDGSLDIAQGGSVTATGTGYIASAANTNGSVRVAGLLDIGSLLYIGNEGSGSLDIAATGTVNNTGFAWIGYTPTSRGSVNVDGLWQSAANILVGGSLGGTGLLTIGATGTVTNPNAYIGWGENTTGTVTVLGHWNPTGGIVVGYGANAVGTLIVESGGTVSPSTASRIASTAGASGTLIIKTGGVWHSGAGINVGYAGSGSAFIHVETGGTLVMDSTTLYVADPAGAYGEVLIDGYYRSGTGGAGVLDQPGSYYTPVGYRNGGVGVFTVGATGTALSGVIDVGRETGSSGTVTINGYWGVAAMTEQSRVGNSGTGVLTIAQGGILISDAIDADGSALNIGNNANGRGVVNVAGLLVHNNGGGLTNGRLGIGALNIASTGTVLLTGQYKQNQNSTLTVATDPARTGAYVTASSFSLSGTLALTGPGLDYTPVAKASELPDTGVLVLTATSGGIHGNFNTVTGFGGGAPDYLAPGGHVRDEGNNVTTYRAGYRLAWDAPTGAHGTFTLADGETFEVDVPLADRYGETDPGWDKKSLTKLGNGTLILSGQNTFTGAITVGSGTLRLGGPATHRYGALVNNGVFDLGAPAAPGQFRTLEVASLSGAGAFRMTVDPAAGDGDHLIVNGAATGSHQLLVSAYSASGGAPQTLTLATIAGANNATFTGGFDYNGVNYAITPTGPGSYGFSSNGASGIHDPIQGVPGSQSLMWFASQDNLSRRLGELRVEAASSRFSEANSRFPEVGTASSLLSQSLADAAAAASSSSSSLPDAGYSGWLRVRAEHDRLGSGGTDIRPFDMDLFGFELGADKTIAITNARVALGLYAAYGHASQDFSPRAGTGAADGSSDQIGLGLYAAWLHTAGWFANITLAAARYDNDFTSHDQSGNRTTADYNDNAIGASLEFGKRIALDRAIAPGWFLEPSAQASLAQLMRDDYRTTGANDLDIRASDATITRLRATLRAGRTWRELELSARVGASHETSSGGEITITNNAADPWRPNVDGARAEAGLGLIWRPTVAGQLYFDYEFATGDAYQKPWSFSLGYRHAF